MSNINESKSFRETTINILTLIYKSDDTLKARYKTADEFINAIRNTDAKGFKKIFKNTKSLKDLNMLGGR